MGTIGVLVWCAESADTLKIVQFVLDCAPPVNDRINRIHYEHLRLGGNK